ncbi:RING finger protein 37 [Hetaerina americana]|uniref:RING finger protein 37 n=1 Tax=Hetaerina americana TaxID=62018 RepID=UPI003A7F5FFB
MAINFCSPQLKTKISSSAVSCEGYDVTNLLSDVSILQSKGFMAESFTRPPVSIYLKFFCNVDINHILLWVEVGRQKSNGLELNAVADSIIYDKSAGDKPAHNSSTSVKIRIGSCKFNHESGVVFQRYNGRFSPKVPSNFLVRHFNTSGATVLRNCNDLEIKIFSTSNSSVPSMKKIEVWGLPGRYCPENIKLNIHTLWNQPIKNTTNVPMMVNLPVDTSDKAGSPSSSNGLCEPVVPEEFLDPITQNIMAIPMTLPSGKSVDVSTLEKFETAESNWGRGPSDPFTGVPFTKSIFPVPNTALKSRIDQFLVANGHMAQFKGVGRTVGREKQHLNHTTGSTRKYEQIIGNKHLPGNVFPSGSQNSSLSSRSPFSSVQIPVPGVCQSSTTVYGAYPHKNTTSVKERSERCNNNLSRGLKRKNDIDQNPSCSGVEKSSKGSHGNPMNSYEDAIEDSLNRTLKSVLAGLPSFIQNTARSISEPAEEAANCKCSHCLTEDCLFKLPCGHLLCRPCLKTKSTDSSKKMECEVCYNQYYSSNVIRFHK